MTAMEFVKMQIPIYLPFGDNEKADLIADFNGKLNKIQVKSCDHLQDDGSRYIIDLTSSTVHRKNGVKYKYSSQDIDYFALYCAERDKVLLIPAFDEKRNTITIRITKPKSKNQYKTYMEQDYLLRDVVNKIINLND